MTILKITELTKIESFKRSTPMVDLTFVKNK